MHTFAIHKNIRHVKKQYTIQRNFTEYHPEASGKRGKNVRLSNDTAEGALYPIVHKLESDGIIESEVQNINGRDRKYYLLTEKGKRRQAEQEAEMKSYILNLNTIFTI